MRLPRESARKGNSCTWPINRRRRQRQNGKLELHVAGALQHIDSGTAVNFENLRDWGHTVLYMRLCFQVDATSKAAI